MIRPLETADPISQVGLEIFSLVAVFFDKLEELVRNRFVRNIVKELMKSAAQPDTKRRIVLFNFWFSG